MNPKNEALLKQRFPEIFANVDSFQCSDGWADLLVTLCECLQRRAKNGGVQLVASDVKEKFGTLSFLHGGADDE